MLELLKRHGKIMKNKQYAGVDISKSWIDVSVFVPATDIRNFPHRRFPNDRKGFQEMLSWMRNGLGFTLKEVSFCMEYTGCYSDELREHLSSKHLKCHMVAPLEMRHRSGVVKDKNDKLDSARIADYLARYNDVLKPTPITPKPIRDLRHLIEGRRLLVSQETAWKNRIKTMEEASEKAICKGMIRSMQKAKEKVEERMLAIIEKDESLSQNCHLLLTIPGIGPINAIVTIANTENFTAFNNGRQYAAYVGVAPHGRTSGTSVRHRRKPSSYADLQAKADLSMAAEAAVRDYAEFGKFFTRKLKGERTPERTRKAMNAVKFKLILRMFALVREREPYDKQRYMASEVNYEGTDRNIGSQRDQTSECCAATSQVGNQDERSITKNQQSQ